MRSVRSLIWWFDQDQKNNSGGVMFSLIKENKTNKSINIMVLCLIFAGGMFGCTGAMNAPVTTTCSKVGEKCKTPDGPLGVCIPMDTKCEQGEGVGCLRCTPQH